MKFAIFAAVMALTVSVSAQAVHTPEKNSPERKAILEALRAPVERELKQSIVFVADNFNVAGSWAFIAGSMRTPGGENPDFSGTKYAEAREAGAFDNNIFALLKRSAGKWRVSKYQIGCTDVCYVDWWRHYKAPKAIFPYTE